MLFLPDPTTLAAYFAACLVLFVTPGPDMSLMLARTLNGGRAMGMASMIGTNLGVCVHTLAAALGLSALLAASPAAFGVLKIVGALYLLWLAVDAVRRGSSLNVRGDEKPASLAASFWTGVAVDLSNPKMVLFFVTFLPQFVSAEDPHASGKLVFLGLMFAAVNVVCGGALVLIADRFVGWLKARPGVLRGVDYSFAGMFGLFAVSVLFTRMR